MNMSLQDIGLRAMYNYHVNKTLQNRRVDFEVVNIWKPADMRQEKIYILNRILEKAKGYDGKLVENKDVELPLLFLTAGWDKITLKNGEIRFQLNRGQAIRRACSRFDDFKKSGLIEGNYSHIAITFTGKEMLEQIVDVDCSFAEKMDEFISEMRVYLRESNQVSVEIEDLVKEIHNSVNRKTSKGEILSSTVGNLANVITILAGIPETVNVVSNGLCLFKNLIDMI